MPAMASVSTPAAADELVKVMTLESHESSIKTFPGGIRLNYYVCTSYFPDGKHMTSGSGDKTIRRWDLEAGKEIQEARIVHEQEVYKVAVSRDG